MFLHFSSNHHFEFGNILSHMELKHGNLTKIWNQNLRWKWTFEEIGEMFKIRKTYK
jgi:hypothetical protein